MKESWQTSQDSLHSTMPKITTDCVLSKILPIRPRWEVSLCERDNVRWTCWSVEKGDDQDEDGGREEDGKLAKIRRWSRSRSFRVMKRATKRQHLVVVVVVAVAASYLRDVLIVWRQGLERMNRDWLYLTLSSVQDNSKIILKFMVELLDHSRLNYADLPTSQTSTKLCLVWKILC